MRTSHAVALLVSLASCAAAPAAERCRATATTTPASGVVAGEDCEWPREGSLEVLASWVLSGGPICEDAFAPQFRDAVPITQVAELGNQLREAHGALVGVEIDGNDGFARFERGSMPIRISRGPAGRIAGLWYGPPTGETVGGVEASIVRMRALPGVVSALVSVGGADVASLEPDRPLAVGSTFKLSVLAGRRTR